MFNEVLKREGGARAARRGVWLLGSTALQVGVVLGAMSLSTALAAKVAYSTIVPVKFVKFAAPAAPPPPPAPRRRPPPQQKKEPPKPPQAMIQPKEIPPEAPPPNPNEPPEPEPPDEALEGGVIGGVVGGTVAAAPPPPPSGPVEFNESMTRPVFLSGPDLEYTPQALEHEVQGMMKVKCVVAVDGTVHSCRVLQSLPFMDRAVVRAMECRRYRPATQAGHPVAVDYMFVVRLQLPP